MDDLNVLRRTDAEASSRSAAACGQTATTDTDRFYMAEALALAEQAAGRASPNPMVGCVLVRGGEIVGRGFHNGPGAPHAEAAAIRDAGASAHGAVAYVTLEPCAHFGRTPPCADALIAAGVAEVVYAIDDPNPVAAGGAARLAAAGVKVRGGVCVDAARFQNRAWLHAVRRRASYVVGKAAISLDGRIAARSGDSKWITGPQARARAHTMRAKADAILVGAGTVIADDPALTARSDTQGADGRLETTVVHAPLRVVLDSAGRTPPGAKAFERSGDGALLATTAATPPRRRAQYEELGVETLVLPADETGRVDLHALLKALWARGKARLFVEGGGQTLGALFDADLIDELALFVAPKIIGGGAPAFGGAGIADIGGADRFDFAQPERLGADQLFHGLRKPREETR